MRRLALLALLLPAVVAAGGRRPSVGPLIPPRTDSTVHVYWNGTAFVDLKANAWTKNGTVARLTRALHEPYGVGPFSAANFWSLPGTAGDDALDYTGDFTICVVFRGASTAQAVANDVSVPASGWNFYHLASPAGMTFRTYNGAAVNTTTTNTVNVGSVNVACAGRATATISVRLNNGTAATANGGVISAATTIAARIGTDGATGATGILEVWAAPVAYSDTLSTQVYHHVMRRIAERRQYLDLR